MNPAIRLAHVLARLGAACLLTLAAVAATAAPRVGDTVPAFQATLLSGKTVHSADFAGKPLVLVFWATWCPPCKPEMAALEKLHQRYRKQGLEILAVSLDDDPAEIRDYLRGMGVSFRVGLSNDAHRDVFGPMLWPPRMFLIGRDGRLAESHWGTLGAEALDASVRKLF